jgi:hypothetical protein
MGIGIVTGPDLKAYSVAVLQERFGKARFEDALGGLAEFEIRRGQQALLLVLVKKAVRRYQLEYLASCRIPAVRPAPARNSSSVSDKVPRCLPRRRRSGIASQSWFCRCRDCPRAETRPLSRPPPRTSSQAVDARLRLPLAAVRQTHTGSPAAKLTRSRLPLLQASGRRGRRRRAVR